MTVPEDRDSTRSDEGNETAPRLSKDAEMLIAKDIEKDDENPSAEKQNGGPVDADDKIESPERRVEFDIEEDEPKEKDKAKPEEAALLSIEVSQQEGWIPDGGWGWAIVAGGVIVHIFVGGLMKASGVMYMKLKDKFQQSAVATAWVFSLFTTFLLLMGPVASALCHRFSCRAVVFWGSVFCFIGILISAFAPNIEFLYFSYCVVGGFGRCLTYTPSLIVVNNYFNKRRGLAVGMTTAGVGLGMFTFPPLIEGIFSNYGYHGAMLILSAISLQTFVCSALFRPMELHRKISKTQGINNLVKMARRGSVDAKMYVQQFASPKPKHKLLDAVKGDPWHGSSEFSSTLEFTYVIPEQQTRRRSVFVDKMSQVKQIFKKAPKEERKPFLELSLLKDFPFLTLCVSVLLFTSSMMSVFVFFPPLARSKGVSQIKSAYLISIIGVSDSIARFTSAFVLDMKKIKPYRLLVYNCVMFGVGIVCMIMPSIEGFGGFAAIAVCYGIFTGTYTAQKSVVVVDVLGLEKMTSSLGLLLGFQGIGSLLGPTISGLFRDVFGSYNEAFYFGGLGIFFGGLIMVCGNTWKIIRDRRKRRREKQTDDTSDDDDDVTGDIDV